MDEQTIQGLKTAMALLNDRKYGVKEFGAYVAAMQTLQVLIEGAETDAEAEGET